MIKERLSRKYFRGQLHWENDLPITNRKDAIQRNKLSFANILLEKTSDIM